MSICREALDRYEPSHRDFGGTWHLRVCNSMDRLVEFVLNNRTILQLTYRSVSVSRMIIRLSKTTDNILAVGKRHSWIINASTGHNYHFIGTRAVAGMTKNGQDKQQIERLKNLVLRYASIGSVTRVYWLHQEDGNFNCCSELIKDKDAMVQVPGCY